MGRLVTGYRRGQGRSVGSSTSLLPLHPLQLGLRAALIMSIPAPGVPRGLPLRLVLRSSALCPAATCRIWRAMGRSWPGPLSLGPLIFTSLTPRHVTIERRPGENDSGHILKTLGEALVEKLQVPVCHLYEVSMW